MKCREDFLQTAEEIHRMVEEIAAGAEVTPSVRQLNDTKRCWTALRYTKSWMSSTTPVLADPDRNQAITLDVKERLSGGQSSHTYKLTQWDYSPPRVGLTHHKVDRETVCRTLYGQSQIKAADSDCINFTVFILLWVWDIV